MMLYLCSKTNILIYYRGYFSLKRFYSIARRVEIHSEQVSSLVQLNIFPYVFKLFVNLHYFFIFNWIIFLCT